MTFAHIQLGAQDVGTLTAFYDRLLPQLGWTRAGHPEEAAGVVWSLPGQRWPQFVLRAPFDGMPASAGNGTQVSFLASSQALVDQLWSDALAAGATDEGAPGLRPRYASDFYAAYCRDPEGHKLCFVHSDDPPRSVVDISDLVPLLVLAGGAPR